MRMNILGVVGEVDTMPGCSQIAVSHAVFLPPERRGKGVGTVAHDFRLKELRRLGYDYVLCTVNTANVLQIAIMEKFHWKKLSEFSSGKTGHVVALFGRQLE